MPEPGAFEEEFPGAASHRAHAEGTAKVPNLDAIRAQLPCDHNEIVVYKRPWRRLFRKTYVWVCIRCDRERPANARANPAENK